MASQNPPFQKVQKLSMVNILNIMINDIFIGSGSTSLISLKINLPPFALGDNILDYVHS